MSRKNNNKRIENQLSSIIEAILVDERPIGSKLQNKGTTVHTYEGSALKKWYSFMTFAITERRGSRLPLSFFDHKKMYFFGPKAQL